MHRNNKQEEYGWFHTGHKQQAFRKPEEYPDERYRYRYRHTLPVTLAGENLLYLLYSSKNQLIMRLPALISGPGMSMYGPIMDRVCCNMK